MGKNEINPTEKRAKTPGSGRVKGTPNKITGDMKAEAWRVFNQLQLDKKTSLLELAKKDTKWFYTVFGCRLVPKIIEGGGEENALLVRIVNAAQRKTD